MVLCPNCAEYAIPDHSAITESERQDYEQQIKDGLAREKELNKMLDKWEEENLISIDEINKMKENSKHIHDGLKAAIEDKQQQIKELEEHSHQQAVTIRSYEEKIYTIKQALK